MGNHPAWVLSLLPFSKDCPITFHRHTLYPHTVHCSNDSRCPTPVNLSHVLALRNLVPYDGSFISLRRCKFPRSLQVKSHTHIPLHSYMVYCSGGAAHIERDNNL